jgi:hypothetical protein
MNLNPMKKQRGLLLLLLILQSANISAQHIIAGPELGMDVVPLGTNGIHRNYQLGLHAGLGGEYDFTDHFGLRTGLYFSQDRKTTESFSSYSLLENLQGIISSFGISNEMIDSLAGAAGVNLNVNEKRSEFLAMNYLMIPVQAAWKMGSTELALGPYAAFNIGGRKKESLTTSSPFLQTVDLASLDTTGFLSLLLPPAESVKITESSLPGYVRSFDYGLLASIVYSTEHLRFGLHYQYGFTDFRNPAPEGSFKSHRALRFSVAWRFNISELFSNVPSMSAD